MTETMLLTQAEKDMIKLKREQEAIAKKEAELRKQVELERNIAQKREAMDAAQKKDLEQIKAAQEFASKLGTGYTVKIESCVEVEKILEYDGASKYGHTVWQENFTRKTAVIVRGEYKIRVYEHIVYSRWEKPNLGYKMYISGPGIDYKEENKALVNTKTVHSKIEDAIEIRKQVAERESKQKSAIASTVEKMKTLYPDAEVTAGKGYEKDHTRYIHYDTVTITLANGIKVVYRVYADGSLTRKEINFGSTNAWNLLDKLNNMDLSK